MIIEIETTFDDEQEMLRRKKLAYMLRMKDKELTAEHQWNKANVCPHCHVTLTSIGICSMGCGYKK